MRYYFFIYFSLKGIFERLSDDGLSAWKSSAAMIAVECMFGIEALAFASKVLRIGLPMKTPVLPIVAFAAMVAIANTIMLGNRERLSEYGATFLQLQQRRPNVCWQIAGLFIAVVVVLTIAAFEFLRPPPLQ
jgi:hypothetical protein